MITMPTIELYEMGKKPEIIGVKPHHRIAIVYSQNGEDHRFLETVSQNWAYGNIKVFKDLAPAIEWLNRNNHH
jgi:hypothetical protein